MSTVQQDTRHRGVLIAALWIATSSSGLSLAVSPEAVRSKTSLEDVMKYENPDVVERIEKELGVTPQQAKALFDDLKRFLWLAAVTPPTTVPTPQIDEAWHRFVLYTKDYADFCNIYFGGFLHHAPQRLGEKRLEHADLFETIDAMHREFGGIPSDNWHYAREEYAG